MKSRVFLASGSYQRQRLLSLLGVEFTVLENGFEERAVKQTDFADLGEYVSAIAAGKVLQAASRMPELQEDDVVVGGDLLCFAAGGQELGKPAHFEQARHYLDLIAGTWHHEVSAVSIWSEKQNLERVVDHIDLFLPPLNDAEKQEYLEIASPLNKAGGLNAAAYVKIVRARGEDPQKVFTVRGSITGVLGFPVETVAKLLKDYGVDVPVNPIALEKKLRRDILEGNPL